MVVYFVYRRIYGELLIIFILYFNWSSNEFFSNDSPLIVQYFVV